MSKAYQHHRNGAYEASIPIVQAQIDGLFRDYGSGKSAEFFTSTSRKGLQDFLDHDSALGLQELLLPLRKVFARTTTRTEVAGKLSRHGILHGRELAYDTELNSAKCLVLLSSVIEWAQIRARVKDAEWVKAHQERYAGSRAVDEQGRQLDRRSFDKAQDTLIKFSTDMKPSYRVHGMYPATSDIEWNVIDPFNRISVRPYYRISDDGDEYWSWIVTTSGFVFGIAGTDGCAEPFMWAGWDAPSSGPLNNEVWKPQGSAGSLVDWGSWVGALL